ncbi:MAG: hypothetical protein KAY37_16790 [Phycisphaerae bacterium]|nr:hypothetical protein [Phycisphaerae bacterium]
MTPYYAAPTAADETGMYADNHFWFRALRHGGELNVGFVGGYVLSSPEPTRETIWDWAYQPKPE